MDDLYNDYINMLRNNKSSIAQLFVLDKYNIIAICGKDNEMHLDVWQCGTEQEIEKNDEILRKLVNEKYYDIEEALEMQRAIIRREQYIRSKIEEFKAYCEDIEKYGL